jgi:hypothetical protein
MVDLGKEFNGKPMRVHSLPAPRGSEFSSWRISGVDSMNGLRMGSVGLTVADFQCEILHQRVTGKNLCAGLRNDLSKHLLAIFIRVSQIAEI